MFAIAAAAALAVLAAAEEDDFFRSQSGEGSRVFHDARFLQSTGERSFKYHLEHMDILGGINHYSYDVSEDYSTHSGLHISTAF